jgi:competence protein ComEC
LLGEGSGMTRDEWDRYQRTGVIHVLAISGQHLVVLAAFLWYAAWLIGIRRRRAALLVALLLLAYGLLTGGRPSVMRAVWVVITYCIGMLLQRRANHANTFALAWLLVALVNPADLFSAGCQLSFLAVAVFVWGVGNWPTAPPDPLQQEIDETRSWSEKGMRWLWRLLKIHYLVNAAVWLAVTPLIAAHFHMVTPIALLLGPPMVLLTSVALLSGFALLLFAGWCAPLAALFGFVTQYCLVGCDLLVSISLRVPCAYEYVANVPSWWLWTFYLGLLIAMTLPIVWQHLRWGALAVGVWLLFGILLMLQPHLPGEFRCSFVAVGHGGCTVIETPQGHVTVYDAGAKTGRDVTRTHIAPFLWSRGIRRIDDVIMSHADLDHFNGLVDLADRFTIGRVVCTPTFAERDLSGMRETLAVLQQRGIPLHVVQAGQNWHVDGVSFKVLHPPAVGPAGKENARSLVLRVQYADCALLLTGDLEEAGMTRVLGLGDPKIDVLMAPHHGSDKSNIPALAAWAKPRCVVSCQTAPLNEHACVKMYEKLGIPFMGTWPHGTVTLKHNGREAMMETYRTQLVWRLRARD